MDQGPLRYIYELRGAWGVPGGGVISETERKSEIIREDNKTVEEQVSVDQGDKDDG